MNLGSTKRIGLVILLIGIVLTVFPQRVEMHIQPEQVLIWEDSLEFGEDSSEPEWVPFEFITGELSMSDGFDPMLYVANSASALMNVTFWLVEDDGALTDWFSQMDESMMILLPEDSPVSFLIAGSAFLDETVTVEAWAYHLRAVPSEYFWFFPYRLPGIAVAAIGLVLYAVSSRREKKL